MLAMQCSLSTTWARAGTAASLRKKISKASVGPVHGTENEAERSMKSIESTSKTMVATETMMDTFTLQWVTWRREVDRKQGISIDFDDQNNLILVTDVSEISLAGERT